MADAYKRTGVDIDAGQTAIHLMKDAVRATYTPQVLSDLGNFGGLYDASALAQLPSPTLVASIDGVGTKTKVAARINRWDTIGQDLVNHCINDILVQGAQPLFFLDYVASSHLEPQQTATIVQGMARACQQAGCALIGGETAEMPGVYVAGEVDVVGAVIGVVSRQKLLDGSRIQAGDVLLALRSSGLHTNGYTLARAVLDELDWQIPREDLNGQSIGEALLAVHRCYLASVQTLRTAVDVRGLAHITGGGVIDNLPRILPAGLGAAVQRGTWPIPPIFHLIQQQGQVDEQEMYRVFNMGLGMLVVIPAEQQDEALALLGDDCAYVGQIVDTHEGVQLV